MLSDGKQSQVEQIAHLPGDVLLSLARNESATPEMRKAAVKLMLNNGFPQYKHPELAVIVLELRREGEAEVEVESIVESAIESEIPGPLRAGFTTANMMQDECLTPAEVSRISRVMEIAKEQECSLKQVELVSNSTLESEVVVRNPDKLADDALVDSYVGMPSIEVPPLVKSEAD